MASKAYNEGYKAACWDAPSKSNPYRRDDPNNADWYRGWFDATEDRKEPPLKYG
jgi:ribosome modulation factor